MFRFSTRLFSQVSILFAAGFFTTVLSAADQAAGLAQAIHEATLDPEQCYRVRDLSLRKEDIKLYLTDGYLIFSKPVSSGMGTGERLSAVFTTDVEGGDGEVILLPPNRGERQSLVNFTQSPNLDEHFHAATLVFTDGSGSKLLEQIVKEGTGRKSPEMGAMLAEKWGRVAANICEGFELRLVEDLLTPDHSSSGFLFLALAGNERGNFDLLYDPHAREQILAAQLAEHDGHPGYDIWSSFVARNVRTGAAKPPEPGFTMPQISLDASLDAELHMKASMRAVVRIGASALRALRFEMSPAMKVNSVRIDGAPAELFYRDSVRGRALKGSDDNSFLAVAPDLLAAKSEHEIAFEYEGAVIASAGNGVYYVGARSTWYPRNAPGFSIYDLSFRYPKKLTLVTSGDVVEDRVDGEWRITHRRTPSPIRIAGFNLGEYDHIAGTAPGFSVEVYGNRRLEPALQPKQEVRSEVADRILTRIQRRDSPIPPIAPPAPDPHARLRSVASDVSASLDFFSKMFGPPALKTLTVAPIPGTFGQGFPGLVYLSTVAYLEPNDRPVPLRAGPQQLFFSEIIEAHEVAHQWWGNVVISGSYQDDWLMEALANYSSLLWIEKKKGTKAMEGVLDDYRTRLLFKDSSGRTIESAGPITGGLRLEASGIRDAWRSITYDKGAWILHMLRRRIGDDRFLKMLAEIRRRYEFRALKTEDFKALAREYLPPHTSAEAIDAFFDNWVYAAGIPTLKVQYNTKGAVPSIRISGTVTQSGVDNDFSIDAPVEIQFAKAPAQTIWVRTSSDGASFSATVKQPPSKVVIASSSVLATK